MRWRLCRLFHGGGVRCISGGSHRQERCFTVALLRTAGVVSDGTCALQKYRLCLVCVCGVVFHRGSDFKPENGRRPVAEKNCRMGNTFGDGPAFVEWRRLVCVLLSAPPGGKAYRSSRTDGNRRHEYPGDQGTDASGLW